MTSFNAIELSLFSSRISAICDEMGAVLRRGSFSPNIKDRLDFSCAIFDAEGGLCAQAAHIPVHLGSMAFAMSGIVKEMSWRPGDMVIVNDPFLGGTHLPDVTLIAPVFVEQQLCGFVVNRAHHATIGGISPGSMPLSRTLHEEGIVVPPSYLYEQGRLNESLWAKLLSASSHQVLAEGDFSAQVSANLKGVDGFSALVKSMGTKQLFSALDALNAYGARMAETALAALPDGAYAFTDFLDDDGMGNKNIPIHAVVTLHQGRAKVDFEGTAEQVEGNINCPISVAAAAVFYVFRCLMPAHTPACAGTFSHIEVKAPAGSLLNARRPAAVVAGNVETSMRIVDVVLGALSRALPGRVPAACHGSMNNVAMGVHSGASRWDYYETIGGGLGATAEQAGMSAVQAHMTNTRNTPVESLELHYPLRVRTYQIRRGSSGQGLMPGGAGIVREYEFLEPTEVTLVSERRRHAPWGAAGGGDARKGENYLGGVSLPGKVRFTALPESRLRIETAGGGAWGRADAN